MGITSLTSERGLFHLLPNYGAILPSTGATFCHCQAQNDASGEKFREAYHRHSEYAFRLLDAWFCSWKTYSQFYPSPFTFSPETPINTGGVRGEGLAQPFTTLHPPFTFRLRMELKRKLALFGRGPKPLFYVPQISQIYTDFFSNCRNALCKSVKSVGLFLSGRKTSGIRFRN